MWDGTCLAVATRQSLTTGFRVQAEEWEDFCRECGFEFIDGEAKGRNEFGEPVGVERLREALETTAWDGAEGEFGELGEEDDIGGDDSVEALGWEGLASEQAELNIELLGMKSAVHGADVEEEEQEEQVEEMGKMMARLQAVKGISISSLSFCRCPRL